MKYGLLFGAVAAWLAIVAVGKGGWWLALLWPALSFAVVAAGYFGAGPRVFGKSPAGVLAPLRSVVVLPYLLLLWTVWHALRWTSREPAYHHLTESIVIGRRLLSSEFPDDIERVVDLTSEFNEPRAARMRSYQACPVLDGSAPSRERLARWVDEAVAARGVLYIHCAMGHGRTGLFAAALLIRLGRAATAEQALDLIARARPLAQVNRAQRALLREYAAAVAGACGADVS